MPNEPGDMLEPVRALSPGKLEYQNVKHWKHRTVKVVDEFIGIFPPNDCEIWTRTKTGEKIKLIARLTSTGYLWIAAWYCWDGASGPTWDTPDTYRASLFHDVIYQFMRLGVLGPEYKEPADRLLQSTMIIDGVILAAKTEILGNGLTKYFYKAKAATMRKTTPVRAAAWYQAVHMFAGGSCRPGADAINESIIVP